MPTRNSKDNKVSSSVKPPSSSSPKQHPLKVPTAAVRGMPANFRVGSSTKLSLVSPSAVMAHLRLLGTFHRLEHSISNPSENPVVAKNSTHGVVLWRVFLHQAVWRFQIWLKCVVGPRGATGGGLRDEEIPPLDVLLVWHTYLLNPRVYADDTRRIHQGLAAVGGLPLEIIALQINPATLKFEPTPAQTAFWQRMTLAPPEPLSLSLSSREELAVECPRCSGPPVQVSWLCQPDVTENGLAHGAGWCQNEFSARCGNCQFEITRESISVGRFAADIATAMKDRDRVLPGTLFDPRECTLSTETAQKLTSLLLQPFVDLPYTQRAIGEHLAWSFSGIERSTVEARDTLMEAVRAMNPRSKKAKKSEKIGLPTREGSEVRIARLRISQAQKSVGFQVQSVWRGFGPRISKMLASYKDNPGPFSLDLVGAIIRQTSFTSKAFNLGWLEPSNSKPPIAQSIKRYHDFLHLFSRSSQFLVPTLDIDLSWHTHQLYGEAYMTHTKKYVGRYVDHDDRVQNEVLSDGFAKTARVWETTFRTPYSECKVDDYSPYVSRLSKAKMFATRLFSSPDMNTYPSEHPNTIVVQGVNHVVLDSALPFPPESSVSRNPEDKRSYATRKHAANAASLKNGIRSGETALKVATTGAVKFGALGASGWALIGEIDQSVLDADTLKKGQCCAGYGMPYFGSSAYGDKSGGCTTGGCSAGACSAGGCGAVGACGGGAGCGSGGGGGSACGGGGGGGGSSCGGGGGGGGGGCGGGGGGGCGGGGGGGGGY